MTLGEVIERIEEFDDELTIYAERKPSFTAASRAVVALEGEEGKPAEAAGLDYFLEVDLAKDAIRVWSEWRGGAEPSSQDKREAVLYYASNDAFLPTELG